MAKKPRFLKARSYCKKAVSACSAIFGLAIVRALTFFIDRARIWRFELMYKLHLKVRSVHDNLVIKNVIYRKVTENRYAIPVRNASVSAFLVSLLLFTSLQYLLPLLNPFKATGVQAGSTTYNWPTNSPFSSAVTTPNMDFSTTPNSAQLTRGLDHYLETGTGTDGSLTVSNPMTVWRNGVQVTNVTSYNINTDKSTPSRVCSEGGDAVNYSVTAITPTSATLLNTPAANCLAMGDEILLINLKGTPTNYANVGNYETFTISSISSNVINFSSVKTKYYGNDGGDANIGSTINVNQIVMLQRVPNYSSVNVTGTLTGSSWDITYKKNGVLFFRNTGTTTVSGVITMDGKGYSGGTVVNGGEGYNGTGGNGGIYNSVGNIGQGGGGGGGGNTKAGGQGTTGSGGGGGGIGQNSSTWFGGGGGGGGYGTVGTGGYYSNRIGSPGSGNQGGAGVSSNSGIGASGGGGGIYGSSSTLNSKIYFGSGGGGGGTSGTSGGPGYPGGSGGGIIHIGSNNITVSASGNISAKGSKGGDNGTAYWYGSGGGGAGGSVYFSSNSVNNSGTVSASGGTGGVGSAAASAGGTGGSGRIGIQHISTSTFGTISPTPTNIQIGSFTGVYQYASSGNIGTAATDAGGLVLDAGIGRAIKPFSLDWSADTTISGQKIYFKVRTAAQSSDLHSASCYGPAGSDPTCSDWSTVGTYFSQVNSDGSITTSPSELPGSILSTILPNRYVEILVYMEVAERSSSPVLTNLTLSYDSLDYPSYDKLLLYKSDASTVLKNSSGSNISLGAANSVGGYNNESTVVLKATDLTCGTAANDNYCSGSVSGSTSRKPQVEVREVGAAFDDTTLVEGANYFASESTSTTSTGELQSGQVSITGLQTGKQYHVRVRIVDAQSRVSAWTAYGNNAESVADFSIEQDSPTLSTFTINSGASYSSSSNVTLNISATDSGGSGLSQMQFSNNGTDWGKTADIDGNITDTGWATYATSYSWNVAKGVVDGGSDTARTVYARVRDNAGNVSGRLHNTKADFEGSGYQKGLGTIIAANGTLSLQTFSGSESVSLTGTDGTTRTYTGASEVNVGWSGSCPNISINIGGASAYSGGDGSGATGWMSGSTTTVSCYDDTGENSASITFNISFRSTQLPVFDTYSSPTIALGTGSTATQIGWVNTSVPGDSSVKFKVATKDSDTGWQTSDFIGPDDTENTFYDISSGQNLSTQHLNKRYLRYKAFLYSTSDRLQTPILDSVSIYQALVATTILDTQTPTGTVAIRDSSSGYALSKNVTLNLEPSDAAPSSGLKDFALSNDGITWSGWTNWSETYRAAGVGYSWTLAAGADGTRNVYVKYRDNAGNVGGVNIPGDNWTPGQAETGYATELVGKYVYNFDDQSYPYLKWKSDRADCSGNQCSKTAYPAPDSFNSQANVLVSPQFNPGVTFGTEYPAQEACSLIGGRLPKVNELRAIYAGKVAGHYSNLDDYSYWTATEVPWSSGNRTSAYLVQFYNNGNLSFDVKDSTIARTRCVADVTPTIGVSVTLDVSGPATTLNINPATPNGDNAWYKIGKPTVAFSSSDSASKTDKTYYEFVTTGAAAPTVGAYTNTLTNSGQVDPYQPSIPVGNIPEGDNTLYWYAVDKAGNVESVHNQQIKVDIQTPATTYVIDPELPNGDNNWYTLTAPTITLSSNDPGTPNYSGVATLYYAWETDTNQAGCTAPKYWESNVGRCFNVYAGAFSPNDGSHTLYYFSKDNAGNADAVTTEQISYISQLPSVPSNFRAPVGDPETDGSHIKLYWNASSSVSGIVAYQILRKREIDSWGQRDATIDLPLPLSNTIYLDSNETTTPNGLNILETGQRYNYKIRARDNAGNWGSFSTDKLGYTADFISPTPVTGVLAEACDGTLYDSQNSPNGKCSDIGNEGFEVKLTWNSSNDTGVGMSKYIIYRSTTNSADEAEWPVVGVLEYASGQETIWFDNDTNNAATFTTDKPSATPILNDSTDYYYRIRAFDNTESGNPTALFPSDPGLFLSNFSSTTTPDVTAPTVPSNVVASPLGLDSSGSHQKVHLTWSESKDYRRRSSDEVAGIVNYNVYQATNPAGPYTLARTTSEIVIDLDGLDEFTNYYYAVESYDSVPNTSARSDSATARTASNSVPTTPTDVTVTTKTGDPATDSQIGHKNTISFNGSYAKNCLNSVGCLTKYEVYRSTNNYSDYQTWLTNGTKIAEVAPADLRDDRTATVQNNQGNVVRSEPYQVVDTGQIYPATSANGLTNATTYYYRVWALDNTPDPVTGGVCPVTLVGVQCNYHSPMTTVEVGTPHAGWDTTADDEAPALPTELKVKDIHDDGYAFKRNIITWARIEDPLRNGTNDFYEYRIYRSDDGVTWEQICTDGTNQYLQAECGLPNESHYNPLFNADQELGLATNYYMDLIPNSLANQYYYYHVTAVDNAGSSFRYSNGQVINKVGNVTYSNESEPARDGNGNIVSESLNPAIAKPTITTTGAFAPRMVNVGVSSASLQWYADQPTDSVVEFKAVSDTEWITIGEREKKNPDTPHVVNLFGLRPATEYEYKLISRNSLGNEDVLGDRQEEKVTVPNFTTNSFTVNYQADKIEKSTVSIKLFWTTNMPANTNIVEYKLSNGDQTGSTAETPVNLDAIPSNGRNCAATPSLCNHTVTLSPLRGASEYTFKIRAMSLDGFNTETSFLSFITDNADTRQFTMVPSSSNVADRNITATSAQIVWQTAVPTTAIVHFGTSKSGPYASTATDSVFSSSHVVVLEGLTPGETYYYWVEAKDINNLVYSSPEYSFKAVLKPKISNMQLKNVTPYAVTIAWDTNIETETVINWGKTAVYGEKRGVSGLSKVHQVVIDNLEDNQEYHYQILAKDETGNEVADTDKIVRTPLDTEGPKITNAKTDILPMGENDTTASVIISWNTNKPATTLVEYDEGIIGGGYGNRSVEDTSLNTSHTVIIKNLKPASSFHYRMVSADKRNNITQSQDYTFVTPTKEKSILQLILKSLEETFAWTKNLNQFFGNIGKRITGKK